MYGVRAYDVRVWCDATCLWAVAEEDTAAIATVPGAESEAAEATGASRHRCSRGNGGYG